MKKLEQWLNSLALSHKPNFDECVDFLAQYFPLLLELSKTEQDKTWHAEGNVAIHTEMVLKELYKILESEASHIKGEKRKILILSALLHDIGKPLVTKPKEINGEIKIVAPKHEEAGANYLAIRILELDLKQSSVQKILGLVGFHHIPKLLPIKNKDFGDYLNLSLNADLELLYWLELADMRGRICEDLDKQVDLLEQYRMFSEDYKLWAVKEPCENLLKKISFEGTASQKEYIDSYAIRQLAQNEITMIEEAPAKIMKGLAITGTSI